MGFSIVSLYDDPKDQKGLADIPKLPSKQVPGNREPQWNEH